MNLILYDYNCILYSSLESSTHSKSSLAETNIFKVQSKLVYITMKDFSNFFHYYI